MLAMSATHRHSAGEADVVAGKPKRPPSMQVAAATRIAGRQPDLRLVWQFLELSEGKRENSWFADCVGSLVVAIVRRVKLFLEGHRFGEPIDRNAIGMCIAR
jgi:hypothetical protein